MNHCVDSAKLSAGECTLDPQSVTGDGRIANRNAVLAMAALYSGSRGSVRPDSAVPFAPLSRWALAQKGVLFSRNGEAMVPASLFLKGDLRAVSDALVRAAGAANAQAKDDPTILKVNGGLLFPKALIESWPHGLSLKNMHCPILLDDLKLLVVSKLVATARGKPWEAHWELQVAHCIVGRWYVLHLESGMKTYRFSLKKVLNVDTSATRKGDGVVPLDLSAITVDFSGGLAELDLDHNDVRAKSFCLNSRRNGHHDARFGAWLGEGEGAVPIVVCVQMRHGLEKSEDELKPQLRLGNGALVDALLSVGSGPSSGTFKDQMLFEKVVRVDGSRFANPSILGLLDPAFVDSEVTRQTAQVVRAVTRQRTVKRSTQKWRSGGKSTKK